MTYTLVLGELELDILIELLKTSSDQLFYEELLALKERNENRV